MLARLNISFLLLASACSGAFPSPALDLPRARTQIDNINTKLSRWYLNEQLDSVALTYARDGILMGPNAQPAEGRAAIKTAWGGLAATHRLQFVLQTTDLLGADSVLLERGRYALRFLPKGSADTATMIPDDHGSYVVGWIHREGRWQIKFDIAVSDGPPGSGTLAGRPAP